MNPLDVKIVVSTSDTYLWALDPFALLFNKYWGRDQRVYVAGYTKPIHKLPPNFTFYSIASPQYPADRWGEGLLKFLNEVVGKDEFFILLLEDFWLSRQVDVSGVFRMAQYLINFNKNVLRMDLTTDRLYAGGMKDYIYYGHYDIIYAPKSQYEMSLQAAMFNTALFTEIVNRLVAKNIPTSPWNMELAGTTIVHDSNMLVLGTRQNLVRYVNGLNSAQKIVNFLGFCREDMDMVQNVISKSSRVKMEEIGERKVFYKG